MAYRRQPYGGWANYGGNINDDDYAAPKGRAPRFDARQPTNRPWERNKATSQDDAVDRGVGNDHNNYGEKKNEEPTPAPQKAQQNTTPAAAAQTTDKYADSYRTAYSKPGSSTGRNDDYADPYRGAATRFEARQPPNRSWERNKAASHEVDNKGDDDDEEEEEEKKGEPAVPQKPQPYASAVAAQPTKNHMGGYGTASNKHAYNYNRCDDDMNVGSRSNSWANRRGGAGVERPVGYGQNIKNAGDDGEEEELRRDFANRFTLSPRREHVIPKKQGEASGGQPSVVVVKELKLYLEHNKFENFAFNKKAGRSREKKQGN